MDFELIQALNDALPDTSMRTYDASLINSIVNANPDIARAILHDPEDGLFDTQECLGAVYSFILLDNRVDGGMLFEWSSPNIWQAHTVFGPTCRGKMAIADAKDIIREMFVLWDAKQLWGQTPVGNRQARMFNRMIGATSRGMADHWASGEVEYFTIDRDDWLRKNPFD